MKVEELLKALDRWEGAGPARAEVVGLTCDSRRVEPGHLFIAITGYARDGHSFIPQALARGAVGVVGERAEALSPVREAGAWAVRVPDARLAASHLADRFFDFPSARLRLVGVTGTNGKTTTTYLIRSLLEAAGRPSGLLGTVANWLGQERLPVTHTTPEPVELQRLLHAMVQQGLDYAVLEASSHALHQKRVAGCRFDLAVFTNLTRDHLDYHGTEEAYFQAKAALFLGLGGGGSPGGPEKAGLKAAVVNRDDPAGRRLMGLCQVPVLTYGLGEGAEVRAQEVRVGAEGAEFLAQTPVGSVPVRLKLTGRYNVLNALAALAVGVLEGVPLEVAARGLGQLQGVPGRLERVGTSSDGVTVLVDFAHTPDGLENLLHTAREVGRGRVIVVFGCGGDRDRGKRPVMGRLAAELADLVVVTSDNPRGEEPEAIMREIEAGIREAGAAPGRYRMVPDRAQAIGEAVAEALPGDLVVVAGKGHEPYQIFRDRVVPFSDREVAREALARREAAGGG
ncbi:MAG: UDP-N-acetylmuramoyl-L-alanyl-D-glutamate--2,6-diaminopimelate ligase [Acetobacteraceae bacterium]|nr:UDP-N-acetylmuramoyl-L-alanyl-D-glutamate--2,6-diaminopimelate ligase [Acetobacteraceae bacterium]